MEQNLTAHKQAASALSDKDKDFFGNKCSTLDRQIDALVYELYGLTPEEVQIVEGNTTDHAAPSQPSESQVIA